MQDQKLTGLRWLPRDGAISGILQNFSLLALIGALLVPSWRRWAETSVDFGRELYVPWRLSEGEVLYRDIAHLFGPLSTHFNAAVFALFGGPSYTLLFWTNILLFSAFALFFRGFIARLSGQLAAYVATVSVILVNGISQQTESGNFNFISPYSHEVIHGMMLSFVVLDQLFKYAEDGKARRNAAAGFVFGLVLLAKVEIAVAAGGAVGWFFLSRALWSGKGFRDGVREFGYFCLFALLPVGLFFAWFAWRASPWEALGYLFEPWRIAMFSGVGSSYFYLKMAGYDKLASKSQTLAVGVAVYLLPTLLLLRDTAARRRFGPLLMLCFPALASVFIAVSNDRHFSRAFPVFAVAILWWAFTRLKSEKDDAEKGRLIALSTFGFFALLSLLKMGIFSRLFHYGFVLSLPALALTIVFMLHHFPKLLEASGGGAPPFRFGAAAFFLVLAATQLDESVARWRDRSFVVGSGSDTFLVGETGSYYQNVFIPGLNKWLETKTTPESTFVVLPEGVMANYLLRRHNPTRHLNFMPPEQFAFTEPAIIGDLQRSPPDYFVIMYRNTVEYGTGNFGTTEEFGKMTVDWIARDYSPLTALTYTRYNVTNKFAVILKKREKKGANGEPERL